jgi:hypothetical protein
MIKRAKISKTLPVKPYDEKELRRKEAILRHCRPKTLKEAMDEFELMHSKRN